MADLRKTKEEWTRFLGREVGFFLACLHELKQLEDKYTRQRTRVAVLGDHHRNVGPGGVDLLGVDFGRNTSVEGVLVARVVGQADPRAVRLFRALGGAAPDLVAEGQGNAGALVVLTERNGSDLRGAWSLAAQPTEDQTDRLLLYPVLDWAARLRLVWDGTVEKDVRSADEALGMLGAVADRLREARQLVREALAAFATATGGRGADFLGTNPGPLVVDTPVRDGSGTVVRRRGGFVPTVARAMSEDSLAGEQSVVGRVVKATPAVFAPSNDGRGRVSAHVPREHCPAARWTFTCVRGKDTGHGGREEFDCTAKVVGSDRLLAFGSVRVKQSFSGPDGIGPFVLERLVTKDGDPQDEVFAPADLVLLAGERDGNTEGGLLFWRVEKNLAGSWDASFYRSANRGSGDLMARAEGAAVGAVFQATERTASGLSLTWRLGPQPQHGAEGVLDLNFFVVENQAGQADSFEITTEVVSEGLLQRLMTEELGAGLHGKLAGQETIPDGWVRAGLWPQFTKEAP